MIFTLGERLRAGGLLLGIERPTPPVEACLYTVETLDQVAPRLRELTQTIITRLRDCRVTVETTEIFLLGSHRHPIEVPCSGNGVSIQMNFEAVIPNWAEEPRARLCVRFDWGTPYYFVEQGRFKRRKSISIRKVLTRLLTGIQDGERQRRITSSKVDKVERAESSFNLLAADLGTATDANDPRVIKFKNARVKRLDQLPTRVALVLNVTHAEALEILKKYGSDDDSV